jgi:hypothetical protein
MEYTPDTKEVFVGFIFDTSFDTPEWRVDSHVDEGELKRTMREEGADSKFSFVVRVQLPDTKDWKNDQHTIRTVVLGDSSGKGDQETTVAKH